MRIEIHLLLQAHLRQKVLGAGLDLGVDLLLALLVIRLLPGQQFAGQHDVFLRRILREQIEILEHEAKMQPFAADLALLLRI